MTVRIITDSTTDVTPAAARQLNLGVVPLKVLFGQEEYRDGIDLTMEEFYTKLTSNDQLPTTSQPSPNDFLTEFEKAKAAGEEIVVLPSWLRIIVNMNRFTSSTVYRRRSEHSCFCARRSGCGMRVSRHHRLPSSWNSSRNALQSWRRWIRWNIWLKADGCPRPQALPGLCLEFIR